MQNVAQPLLCYFCFPLFLQQRQAASISSSHLGILTGLLIDTRAISYGALSYQRLS
jgi:hypothetical protein